VHGAITCVVVPKKNATLDMHDLLKYLEDPWQKNTSFLDPTIDKYVHLLVDNLSRGFFTSFYDYIWIFIILADYLKIWIYEGT
jgi:hypothetical protein